MRPVQAAGDPGVWDMLTGQPAPHLRTYVSSYQGYDEFVPAGRRMQVPHPNVVFIIGLAGR